ncbi:MAG TPA: diacylglycerol kinase family protein, partial [Pyrinomonadaceae bacterium]|nr:diacylglycerol kinase family protein [Pyrinomonadaceae bacterium]
MRPLIIINNAAARAREAWPIVRARLEQSGIVFDFVETTAPGDAALRARAAYESGNSLVAVVGGDGTLSEAAGGYFNGLGDGGLRSINPNAALSILPSGTGNDFARTLTGQRKPLSFWIDNLVDYCRDPKEEKTRVIDVIRVRTDGFRRSLICINASTLGLGGETASRVAAQGASMRKLSGELRFVTAAMGA